MRLGERCCEYSVGSRVRTGRGRHTRREEGACWGSLRNIVGGEQVERGKRCIQPLYVIMLLERDSRNGGKLWPA